MIIPSYFVGWIYGNKEDEYILRALGVEGDMLWSPSDNSKVIQPYGHTKNGIFEFCTITMDVARRLSSSYPAFTPTTFTGLDENGNQTEYQPLWKGEYY